LDVIFLFFLARLVLGLRWCGWLRLGVGGNGWFGRKGSGGVLMRGGFGGVGDGEAFEPGNYIWGFLGTGRWLGLVLAWLSGMRDFFAEEVRTEVEEKQMCVLPGL
jgi:hypothetical protein